MRAPPRANATGRTVFINCPYDLSYKPTFDAIVFAIHDCGFQAQFAAERIGGTVRLTRIMKMLTNSALSIHDISRVELSKPSKLPRFNMPFEAGVAYTLHHQNETQHDLLLIDTDPHRYNISLSDASGLDIQHYKDATSVISCIRNFIDGRIPDVPGEAYISRRYTQFKRKLAVAALKSNITTRELEEWAYARKYQELVVSWIRDNK